MDKRSPAGVEIRFGISWSVTAAGGLLFQCAAMMGGTVPIGKSDLRTVVTGPCESQRVVRRQFKVETGEKRALRAVRRMQ